MGGPGPPGPSLKSGLEGNWDGRGKMKGRERKGVKEGEGCGRDRFGEGRGEKGRARKGKGAGMRKRGEEESWNRAANWLRPALSFFIVCFILLMIAP